MLGYLRGVNLTLSRKQNLGKGRRMSCTSRQGCARCDCNSCRNHHNVESERRMALILACTASRIASCRRISRAEEQQLTLRLGDDIVQRDPGHTRLRFKVHLNLVRNQNLNCRHEDLKKRHHVATEKMFHMFCYWHPSPRNMQKGACSRDTCRAHGR